MAAQATGENTTPAPTGSLGARAMALVDQGIVAAGAEEQTQTDAVDEAAGETGDASAVESTEEEQAQAHASEIAELESFFGQGAEEDQASEEEDDDGEIDFEEDGAPSRAQSRIRSLSNRLKETAGQLAQFQQHQQASQDWQRKAWSHMQQMQQANQQLQIQLAEMRARTEAMAPPQEDDPVARLRGDIRGELLNELSPELKRSQQQLQALRTQLQNERRMEEQKRRRMEYNQQVDHAVAEHLKPYLDEETYGSDGHFLGALTLSLASAMGPRATIPDAAQELRRRLFRITRGFIRARNAQNGTKVAQSQGVPEPTPTGRAGTHGGQSARMPSMSQLRAAGYKNHLKWQMDGSPPLR